MEIKAPEIVPSLTPREQRFGCVGAGDTTLGWGFLIDGPQCYVDDFDSVTGIPGASEQENS